MLVVLIPGLFLLLLSLRLGILDLAVQVDHIPDDHEQLVCNIIHY